ncbi:hypothetical protein LTR53_013937, partial [Teratosphaeriaceae sp. CCFEE 6253]
QVRRLHSALHLPRRPPADHHAATRRRPRGLRDQDHPAPPHPRDGGEHRPALRQDAASVAAGLHAELQRQDQTRPHPRARREGKADGRGGCRAVQAEVGVLLLVLRGRLRDQDAGGCHLDGGQGGGGGDDGGCAVV